jgi:hypothetical protein
LADSSQGADKLTAAPGASRTPIALSPAAKNRSASTGDVQFEEQGVVPSHIPTLARRGGAAANEVPKEAQSGRTQRPVPCEESPQGISIDLLDHLFAELGDN